MLQNFALWIICFGLSCLLGACGWVEQGKAFMIIYLVISLLIIADSILRILFCENELENKRRPIIFKLLYATTIGVLLFATWVSALLFDRDYYSIFQIMTLVCCCDEPLIERNKP